MALNVNIPVAPENEYYQIREIPGKGYGCIALQPIERGTRILEDDPLLIIPFAHYLKSDIEKAFAELTSEQKKLYLSLHSSHGQDPRKWPSKIADNIYPRERQRIEEQHAARTTDQPSLLSIFQTNCMEMKDGAAVFPQAARFNHCCNPNACFTWNDKIGKETIHIMNHVVAGDEITISYCDMIHDKPSRTYELKHYGFVCDCRACADESDETTFAHESAERRFKLLELDRETKFLRGSRLNEGAKQENFASKLLQMAVLHQREGDFTPRLAVIYLDIALVCEVKGDLRMAEMAAVKAVEIKKNCQGTDFPTFAKYIDFLDRIRRKLAMQRP
ncbi:SET domain-containing protein [Decorospora gaudefroyi]|uniref:SET domain-containing protein n=1 Tax=Decorospora gaudefroyi TaxID=184978 RepID=A0A6A5KK96_9PLEO|nr:SET domain-containing protein [Decorospora gaudefroyi]